MVTATAPCSMPHMQDYRRLHVWRRAHAHVLNVRRATNLFPRTGFASTKTQLLKTAESVPFTLVEGCGAFTQKEMELLRFLLIHPSRAFSRDELLHIVWGYRQAPLTRTVDTHVARLRHKLEDDPHNPRYIQTVYGTGYAFIP